MMIRAVLGLLLALGLAAPAVAQDAPLAGLTVKLGESWIFKVQDGQPAEARMATAGEQPGEGEILVTLADQKGRLMKMINNSPTPYNYRAFITSKPGKAGKRTSVCTLMSNRRAALENWSDRFPAIRIADFTAVEEGRMQCS